MQIETFWKHWQITENPFRAEEARDDPVLRRLMDAHATHPEFPKIAGEPDRPSSAVVFGEKGSGKTALKLMLDKRLQEHNAQHADRKVWIVRYDDLNPVFDRFAHSQGRRVDEANLLHSFRLEDHQDAILSRAVTRLVDSITGGGDDPALGKEDLRTLRRMTRHRRVDLATLAALYDDPRTGSPERRWDQLRRTLRLGWLPMMSVCKWGGLLAALAAFVLYMLWLFDVRLERGHQILIGVCAAAAIVLLGFWAFRQVRLWWLGRKLRSELRVVDRTPGTLRRRFADLRARDLAHQPLPMPGDHDARYQLTSRFLDVISTLGYSGMIVLLDRVDEPVIINGDPRKMQAVVWPLFNNKFLQQDRMGVKMLLPVELRHLLRKEDPEFYQRARLDKQHMIDRLVWSGTSLYDLCSRRLQACRSSGASEGDGGDGSITLTDLFEDDVNRQDLIDALDQMQQPRDAFKFLYQTIQEHCATVPEEAPQFKIPRLALQQARKQHAQRVIELQRGLTPA